MENHKTASTLGGLAIVMALIAFIVWLIKREG